MATNVFGFQSNLDEQVAGTPNGSFGFGLNTNCKILAMEFLDNGTNSDSKPIPAMQLRLEVGGREFKMRIFDIQDSLYVDKQRITLKDTMWGEAFEREMQQRLATITHVVKAVGVTDGEIKTALEKHKPKNFTQWVKTVLSLVTPQRMSLHVDVFLEYQWNIRPGSKRTFLQIPNNMKGGKFLCPSTGFAWTEVNTEKGLHYENVNGDRHPFVRSSNYMDSNKAKKQVLAGDDEDGTVLDAFLPNTEVSDNGDWADAI